VFLGIHESIVKPVKCTTCQLCHTAVMFAAC